MYKNLVLLAACASKHTFAYNDIPPTLNITNIETDVKVQVINQIMTTDLQGIIDERVNKVVEEMIASQQQDTIAEMTQFENLLLKQKLMDILEALGDKDSLSELDLTLEEMDDLDNIQINFNTKDRSIAVHSTAADTKGDALYEWNVNTTTGDVTEIKRDEMESTSVTTQKHIDPLSLTKEGTIPKEAAKFQTEEELIAEKIQNWDEMDMQRDIAFKVMYFFIVFIIGTFGLLFAYFQMSQRQEEEEAARKGQPQKGKEDQDKTFFDFLAGQMDDENYNVNPYARQSTRQSVNDNGTMSVPLRSEHRDDSGFGSQNLESLGEPAFYQH